jgi:hypothetical protein
LLQLSWLNNVDTDHIKDTPFPTVNLLLLAYSLQRERVYRAVVQKQSLFKKLPPGKESMPQYVADFANNKFASALKDFQVSCGAQSGKQEICTEFSY